MKPYLPVYLGLSFTLLLSCSGGEQKKAAGNDTSQAATAPVQSVAGPNDSLPGNVVAISDSSIFHDFPDIRAYLLSDTIRADLNGDSLAEKTYFISKGQLKQIAILDGGSGKELILGGDPSFADIGEDFSWVNAWGTTAARETYEILIKDGELVGQKKTTLQQTSLVVRGEESGGGLISYKKGRYIWVHQAD